MPAARTRRARPRTTRSPELTFDALEWRNIGPWRGGRVGAVAADPNETQTFYFGSTGGGVWKTTDAGLYWENVSDGFFKRASVGAIAVAQSDPNVLYVGMGESCIRGNVSHGDGVYRSTDAGKTWQHKGLAPTRHIAKVRIHPGDPDLVYVAALGHAHGPNPERGVFRSRDGGKTWDKVLYRGPNAGASDLSMDPKNPRILYAAFWETIRRPWELVSGGPGSGIFRSTDGGETWTDISRNKGLPKGVLGKIGISVSQAKEGRVYAIVEAVDGAVPVVVDGGVRRGIDVFKAVALGASAVMVGRPTCWGLAVAGEEGVRDTIRNLAADFDLTLGLAGCSSVAEIGPEALAPAPG
jgi:photosystem II stability/assembly factor-like uncharacterized protein